MSRDFQPPVFFMIRTHLGPLIIRLKYFRIQFQFRRDIQIFKKLCGVHIIPRSQTWRCAAHHGDKLCGVHPTAESDSAVCIIPWSQALRFATHRGVKLRGLQHTLESKCTPRSQNRNLWESLVAFKGTIRKNPFRGKLFYHVRQDLKKTILNC